MLQKILIALWLLPGLLPSAPTSNAADNFMHARGKPKKLDREALRREVDQTQVILEELALQLPAAPNDEIEEIWATGPRDFKISGSLMKDARKASEFYVKALALKDEKEATELKDKGWFLMRPYHRERSEAYIREMRNWLTICGGTLRRANAKRARAAAKALSPTAK